MLLHMILEGASLRSSFFFALIFDSKKSLDFTYSSCYSTIRITKILLSGAVMKSAFALFFLLFSGVVSAGQKPPVRHEITLTPRNDVIVTFRYTEGNPHVDITYSGDKYLVIATGILNEAGYVTNKKIVTIKDKDKEIEISFDHTPCQSPLTLAAASTFFPH